MVSNTLRARPTSPNHSYVKDGSKNLSKTLECHVVYVLKNGGLVVPLFFLLEQATHPDDAQKFRASCSDIRNMPGTLSSGVRKVSLSVPVAFGSLTSSLRPSHMLTRRTAKRSSLGLSCHDRMRNPGLVHTSNMDCK